MVRGTLTPGLWPWVPQNPPSRSMAQCLLAHLQSDRAPHPPPWKQAAKREPWQRQRESGDFIYTAGAREGKKKKKKVFFQVH